jgi:hypothetical protein
MRNVPDKSCRGTQNTHFMFSNFFFEYRVVYEVMWKKYSGAGVTIDDNMAHAHFTLGTKDHKPTLTEYVLRGRFNK